MPIISTTKMTANQFLQLGEDPAGVRLELVEGEIAESPSPAPDHSYVVIKLARILDTYIEAHDLGELHQDVDTLLDQTNVRRPDLLFFSKSRTHLIGDKAMLGAPDLAIEIVSPSSIQIDREDKFEQYAQAGVAHYWIFDPANKTGEGWTLINGEYELRGNGQRDDVLKLPPFPLLEIPLKVLWRK